jgi:hypothetical protein
VGEGIRRILHPLTFIIEYDFIYIDFIYLQKIIHVIENYFEISTKSH